MFNEGGNQGIETDGPFTMQAMHQQFERLNIMFNANLQRGQPRRGPNNRRQQRRAHEPLDEFDEEYELVLGDDEEDYAIGADMAEVDILGMKGGLEETCWAKIG